MKITIEVPENLIDWKEIWMKHEEWFNEASKSKYCKLCGWSHSDPPEWSEQEEKIEKLVEEHIRKRLPK